MTDYIETGTQLLIVGAGPTGHTPAIEFQRRGIDSRVVERTTARFSLVYNRMDTTSSNWFCSLSIA
jgi:2-polyprenyl-6-methoxyphenol hydroxylase-like FAD-dependent oxidoreductase